jgi:hypothetical protein
MKLKLVSDGTVAGTRLVNAETGEPIGLIQDIRIRARVLEEPMIEALIQCVGMELELTGEFKKKERTVPIFDREAPTHPGKANAIIPPPSEDFPKREPTTKPTPRPGIYADMGGMKSEPAGVMEFENREPEVQALVDRAEELIVPTRETLHGTPIGQEHEIDKTTGMQKDYVVLSDAERAKGFVRPVRQKYKHVGTRPKYALRELTPEEHARYDHFGYAKYEEYPKGEPGPCGRYWTEKQLNSGCGSVTTMGIKLAETYARQPDFYGGTFCASCKNHYPVGKDGEFIWDDGSGEKVGT